MRTRTALVTGGTDGLGLQVARSLAARGWHVLVHGRSASKLANVQKSLRTSTGNSQIDVFTADFARLADVETMATHVTTSIDSIDILINNAGIAYVDDQRESTIDGHEKRFAVNFLASFALTLRLLPLLESGSAPGRVVNVASEAQQSIDFEDVMLERRYSGARAYAQSKFAMVAAGFALARRLDAAKTTVTSLHPGTMMPTRPVLAALGHSVDSLATGVASIERAALDPALAGRTGLYFNRQEIGRPHPESLRRAIQEQVWALGTDLTGAAL